MRFGASSGMKVDHTLVGRDVHFKGSVWKVVSAHKRTKTDTAWLTLRRGLAEAVAKAAELEIAFN